MYKIYYFILTLCVVFIFACDKQATESNNPPSTPTITANTHSVQSGDSINLSVNSTDPDGDLLNYLWSSTGGSFNSTSQQSVIWTAPNVTSSQTITITVEVKDNSGASSSSSINITVNSTGGTTYLINDDFENYSLGSFPSSGGWNLIYNGYGTSYQYISESSSISGTKSFQLEGRTNWSATVIQEFNDRPSVIYFEGYVRTKKLASSVMNYSEAVIGLYNKDVSTWGTQYAQVYFNYDGYIKFGASGVSPTILEAWVPDTWYKIKVRYDKDNKLGDVLINDILKASNVDLSGTSGIYSSLTIIGGNDTHTRSWFDDIKVWY